MIHRFLPAFISAIGRRPVQKPKSAKPSRTEALLSMIEIIDALGIWFLYVQTTLEPEILLALLRTGGF
jgi:hypothetical protein